MASVGTGDTRERLGPYRYETNAAAAYDEVAWERRGDAAYQNLPSMEHDADTDDADTDDADTDGA